MIKALSVCKLLKNEWEGGGGVKLHARTSSFAINEQVSISPTFYEQLYHQNPFAKILQTQIVST
jgi:hypothetical protein